MPHDSMAEDNRINDHNFTLAARTSSAQGLVEYCLLCGRHRSYHKWVEQ